MMIALGLITASLLTLATAQDCETAIDQCFGGLPVINGALSLNNWTQLCNAFVGVDSCLDALDTDCALEVRLTKFTLSNLCSLEYQDFLSLEQCITVITGTASFSSCIESVASGLSNSDLCSYFTDTSACYNNSFTQECDDVADEASTILTGTLVIAATFILDATSLCPLLANSGLVDTVNRPVSNPDTCVEITNACYGEISWASLFDEALPQSTRQALHGIICANLDLSQVCLAGVQGDDDCQSLVDLTGALMPHICSSSFSDVLDGYHCILLLSDDVDCDVPEYDGSAIESYYCSTYTQYVGCYGEEIDQTCTRGNEWAKLYFAVTLAVSAAHYLSPTCPLLQYLGDNSPSNPSPPDISFCQELINLCYRGYDLGFPTEETLSGSLTELWWSGFCNAHAESANCLASVSAQQGCGIIVDVNRGLNDFICATSYSDIQAAVRCMEAVFVHAEDLCVGLPDYDGSSDMADFQCRYYTVLRVCINREIVATCDTDTASDAVDLVAVYMPYSLASELHDDCPFLQPANGGVSGPRSSAWLTTGLLPAGIAMMRMLTT